MSIKFDLKIDDYLIFYKRLYKKGNPIFKPYVFLIGLLIVYLLVKHGDPSSIDKTINRISAKSAIDTMYWIQLIYYSALTIGIIFLIRYLILKALKNQISNNLQLLGLHELTLTDDKLIVKKTNILIEYNYAIFKNIQDMDDYCFVYISKNNAIIIPKMDSEFNNFISLLKDKINSK